MNYKALYRKYRPDVFLDVVGQENVVQILKNEIINNKIGHAYLFNGTRGTGKTSIAKIFAKTVNCLNNKTGEKCNKCAICQLNQKQDIDIIEIDAASNNGVAEIREIRTNTKILPNQSKYKVYIIDEVHMLSKEAFNALLKTLEEPPAHVIFILATTEIQKIPLTIISRCQKFEFKKLSIESIFERLKYISKQEKININDKSLSLISELCDGGLRDAINLLDQISSVKNADISELDVYDITGTVEKEKIKEFINFIYENNLEKSLEFINFLGIENKNINFLLENVITIIREIILNNIKLNNNKSNEKYIIMIKEFINLNNTILLSPNQITMFEITVIDLISKSSIENNVLNEENVELLNIKETKEKNIELQTSNNNVNVDNTNDKENDNDNDKLSYVNKLNKIRLNNVFVNANKNELKTFLNDIDEINNYLSDIKYHMVANILVKSKLVVASENILVFNISDDSGLFLCKQNIELIEELLNILTNKNIKFCCVSDLEWVEAKAEFLDKKKKKIPYILEAEEDVKYNSEDCSILKKEAIELFGNEKLK